MYDPWKSAFGPTTEYHPRYYANCARCGERKYKKRMTALYVKEDSYSPVRILCHICPNCLPALLDYLAVGMPDTGRNNNGPEEM